MGRLCLSRSFFHHEVISFYAQAGDTGSSSAARNPDQAVKGKRLEQGTNLLFGKEEPAVLEFFQNGLPAQSQAAVFRLLNNRQDREDPVQPS